MISDTFFQTIKEEASRATWAEAVEWARARRVTLEKDPTAAELHLRVTPPDIAVSARVVLALQDMDWTCDCSSDEDPCTHVVTAAIAVRRAKEGKESLPRFVSSARLVLYTLEPEGETLHLRRWLSPTAEGGATEPLTLSLTALATGRIKGPEVATTKQDLGLDLLFNESPNGPNAAWQWAKAFALLADGCEVTLNGALVKISSAARGMQCVVRDGGVGVVLTARQDPEIAQSWSNGIVRCGGTYHPALVPNLKPEDRRLLGDSTPFAPKDYAWLVSDVIPRLRAAMPVVISTQRLPGANDGVPVLVCEIQQNSQGALVARPRIAYGEPMTAWLDGDRLQVVDPSAGIPARHRDMERRVMDECGRVFDVAPGEMIPLGPESAVTFQQLLDSKGVRTFGVSLSRYRVHGEAVPQIGFSGTNFSAAFAVERVAGATPQKSSADSGTLSWDSVWTAWRAGKSLIPLVDGGFARIPAAFMKQHGQGVQDLMFARKSNGTLPDYVLTEAAGLATELGATPPRALLAAREQMNQFEHLSTWPLPKGIMADFRPYQEEGIRWLSFIKTMSWGGLLADDMGLGKTLQTIACLEPGSLVAVPVSVLWNWKNEIAKFAPHLAVHIYHGGGRTLPTDQSVVITSHGTLRADVDRLAGRTWPMFVVDEAHAIKNPDSQLSVACRKIDASCRVALTGTPVENSLVDMWSIFQFLNPGLLGTEADFRARHAAQSGDQLPTGTPDLRMAQLRERIKPFIMRRKKSQVLRDLPLRTEQVLSVPLSTTEREVYDGVLATVRGQITAHSQMMDILEGILRLRQSACHPALLPMGKGGRDNLGNDFTASKLDLLCDRLDEAVKEGHRSLVFSQWTGFLDLIEPALTSRGIKFLRLDGSTRNREEIVSTFQSEGEHHVLIMSLKAGGVGLNLTAADHVFIMDPWWNPAAEDQAADRAHRIGQTNPVTVYRLVAERTIEERILELQAHKRQIAAAAIESGGASVDLSRDDLLRLLS